MNKIKWEPLGNYRFSDTDFIVFAKRKNNGLVVFKTQRVHKFFGFKNSFIPNTLIDTAKQWEKIANGN